MKKTPTWSSWVEATIIIDERKTREMIAENTRFIAPEAFCPPCIAITHFFRHRAPLSLYRARLAILGYNIGKSLGGKCEILMIISVHVYQWAKRFIRLLFSSPETKKKQTDKNPQFQEREEDGSVEDPLKYRPPCFFFFVFFGSCSLRQFWVNVRVKIWRAVVDDDICKIASHPTMKLFEPFCLSSIGYVLPRVSTSPMHILACFWGLQSMDPQVEANTFLEGFVWFNWLKAFILFYFILPPLNKLDPTPS